MKVDTVTLKSNADLRHLASQYTTLRGREGAKENYGPCPKCKGADRFHVTKEWFFCRHCHEKKGDAIEFLQWVEGLDFRTACERLAGGHLPTTLEAIRPAPRPSSQSPLQPPGPQWQTRARAFVEHAQKLLWQPIGKPGLDYLRGRGFTSETIHAAGLGYNPHDINDSSEKWGVIGKDNIWLPGPGIVIPWFIENDCWRINIRLLETRAIDGNEVTKIGPAGWANGLYLADNLTAIKPAILVEGELDALTIRQHAGNIIRPVASGGTTLARRDKWVSRLAACPLVLIAFDADKPGDEAAQFWLGALPNVRRWRPFWKDANAMVIGGADIRAWIESGLRCYGFELPAAQPAEPPMPAWVDPDQLYRDCQRASYPRAITWPEGETVYQNGDQLYGDFWQRSMVKEAQWLGGVVK